MAVYSVSNAKIHLSQLIKRATNGEEVMISKNGKTIARILPFAVNDVSPRKPGIDKGKVIILAGFDDRLEEFDV